jgi:hypothetical protein
VIHLDKTLSTREREEKEAVLREAARL